MYADDLEFDAGATLIEDADDCIIGVTQEGYPVYALSRLQDWLDEQIEKSPEQFCCLGLVVDLTPDLIVEELNRLAAEGVYNLLVLGSVDDGW